MRRIRALIAIGAAVALAVTAQVPASAHGRPPVIKEWPTQLAAPFSMTVDGNRLLIADGGTGVIGRLKADGSVAPVVEGVPGLAGLATRGGWMAYGSTVADETTEPPVITESGLNIRNPRGTTKYADVHAYETANNPDKVNTYGVTDPNSCAAGMSYTGLIDAHVYAVASWKGSWLIADAGANAIFKVSDRGAISTLAVLPAVPVKLTAELVGMLGLGDCAIGDTYYAEPVPTGIAIGQGGVIYVSTLPGFPGESVSAGAVWKIDPRNGKATQVVSGLSGPTSIAVSGRSIYVAELFGAGVSVINGSSVKLFAELPGALSVATGPRGTVWAATMASDTGPGKLVSISNHKMKVHRHFRR